MNLRQRTTFVVSVMLIAAPFALAQQTPARTFVTLMGHADDLPRLGNPAIHVEVLSAAGDLAESLARALTVDLDSLAHSRPDRGEAPYDYRLEVRVDPPPAAASADPLRFTATMEHPARGIVWRTEGRTELSGRPVDTEVIAAISRNLVSALVHDRWIAPKLDPDDPPPAAPFVRLPE